MCARDRMSAALALGIACFCLFPAGIASGATFTLQPGPGANDGSDDGSAAAGKDTFILSEYPNSNGGSSTFAAVEKAGSGEQHEGFLRFSLEGLPTTQITYAEVALFTKGWREPCGAWTANPVISVYPAGAAWSETALIWNNRPVDSLPAVDSQTAVGFTEMGPAGSVVRWMRFDITTLYQEWVAGSVSNDGLRFSMDNPDTVYGCTGFNFYTSDFTAGPSFRPLLTVYTERRPYFHDTFEDALIGQADPQWDVVQGTWKVVAPTGYAGGNVMKSPKGKSATVLVRDEEIFGGSFRDGLLSLRFKVGAALRPPFMSFFFNTFGPDAYRDVRVRQKPSGAWFLELLQRGDYDGDTTRVVASKRLGGFSKRYWHRLEVEVAAGGQVDITLTDETKPANTWTLSGAFNQNSGGSVGIYTWKTSIMVDDYKLESPLVP